MDASMITALLEDAGIPSFIKDRGMGGYLKIYMGYTIYGQDIYVNEESYDKAKELLDFYFNSTIENIDEDMITEDSNIEYEPEEIAKYKFHKGSTVARIIIILFMLTCIGTYILNYLY
jgi:hypothetical protein